MHVHFSTAAHACPSDGDAAVRACACARTNPLNPMPTAPNPTTTTTTPYPNNNRDLTESPTALRAEFARRLFLTEEQQLQVHLM